MATIEKRKKAMAVSPLKASQTLGASIAFLGINRSIPMMHGSQGCTAFGKVFFVRHFREPIPLQTTAMAQASSVMGADDNVVLGLKAICQKSLPDLIGLPTTGLSETQGCDILRNVKEFRNRYPQFDSVAVVPVNTPDFAGSFETGYAAAVEAMIRTLVPTKTAAQPARSLGHCKKKHEEKITVLAGPGLAIGDVEWIKETIEAFGLTPILVPDLSDSLDGHLTDRDFSPVSVGGTPVSVFNTLQESIGTLVVGGSLNKAADVLAERTGVVDERFDHLQGLAATDRFLMTLSDWSQRDVPPAFARRRSQLQDAMLDTHFMISDSRLAIAADPDVLLGFADLIAEMGGNLVAAVTASSAARLTRVDVDRVQVGDLEDLESIAKAKKAELLISNSHALASATRLGVPLLRAGFPQYDHLGGYARCWSGYRASRQTLFDLANLLTESRHNQLEPYRSELSVKDPTAMPASTCQTPLVLESGHVA